GYVAARHLKRLGWTVDVAHLGTLAQLKGDAAQMANRWDGPTGPLEPSAARDAEVVVDALFGAGLSRPIEGVASRVIESLNRSDVPVIAIDVPSGLHGDAAHALGGICIEATLTVTFFRKKLAHVLMPGAQTCGEVVVADIGIPDDALGTVDMTLFENGPLQW